MVPARVVRVVAGNDMACIGHRKADSLVHGEELRVRPAGAALKDMLIERPKVKLEKPSGST